MKKCILIAILIMLLINLVGACYNENTAEIKTENEEVSEPSQEIKKAPEPVVEKHEPTDQELIVHAINNYKYGYGFTTSTGSPVYHFDQVGDNEWFLVIEGIQPDNDYNNFTSIAEIIMIKDSNGWRVNSFYALPKENYDFDRTYEDWLEELKGRYGFLDNE